MCILAVCGSAGNPICIQLPAVVYKCVTGHVKCRPLVQTRKENTILLVSWSLQGKKKQNLCHYDSEL